MFDVLEMFVFFEMFVFLCATPPRTHHNPRFFWSKGPGTYRYQSIETYGKLIEIRAGREPSYHPGTNLAEHRFRDRLFMPPVAKAYGTHHPYCDAQTTHASLIPVHVWLKIPILYQGIETSCN